MNGLQDPDLQIVLFIKEGKDFNFVKHALRVSATLNGYSLQTERAPPGHTVYFNSQLVWEVTTKILRELRTQNVPIKVEVYCSPLDENSKLKLGYFLVNLAGAQLTPRNKVITSRQSWHKLLGIPSVGKYHSPQLLIGLTMQNIKQTGQESNSARSLSAIQKPTKNVDDYLLALNNYSSTLDVKLDAENGVIVVGPEFESDSLYLLSITIGCAEHLDTIQLDSDDVKDVDFYVSYKLFDQIMKSDKRPFVQRGQKCSKANFNQKINHRVKSCLPTLFNYFHDRPYCIIVINCGDKKIGVCSVDMRKVVTGNINNDSSGRTVCERCFIMSSSNLNKRRAYLDVVVELHFIKPWKQSSNSLNEECNKATSPLMFDINNAVRKSITMTDLRSQSTKLLIMNVDDSISPKINKDSQSKEISDVLRQLQSLINSHNKGIETVNNINSSSQTTGPCATNFEHYVQTEEERAVSPILFKEPSPEIRADIYKRYKDELEELKSKEMEEFRRELNRERLEVSKLKNELSANLEHCRKLSEQLNKATASLMEKSKLVNCRETKLIVAREVLEKHYTKVLREIQTKKCNIEINDSKWHMESYDAIKNRYTKNADAELRIKLIELEKENERLRLKLEEECNYKELNRHVRKIIGKR